MSYRGRPEALHGEARDRHVGIQVTATGEPEELWHDIPRAFQAWSRARIDAVSRVSGGTLNWNYLVEADGRRFFLRCYRANLETERIVGEHDLVEWVAQRDLPVAVPMRALEGETLALVGERRWALFPWMPGGTVQRGSLSAAQVRALGAMHGRTQALLATHPDSAGATMIMRWDKQQSLGLLARLVTVATEKGIPDWIIDGIALQRRLLEAADVWTPDRYAALPCQLIHGDFHDQQVLFAGDTVTAVVDWEIWHADPRAWELVRSLAFSLLLLPPRLEDYLAGYREHVRLSEDEVRLALRLWFQSRLVGLWAWWAYLMDDNKRVEAFFPEMIAELSRVTDERWTDAVGTRFVRAACQ